jgi:chromate transport protein ChrA
MLKQIRRMKMDWTNATIVLTWLAGIGAPAVVAILLSLLAENWKAWTTFPTLVKTLVPMVVSILLSVGSSMLLKYPELLAQIQPWFQVITSAIIAYIASQKTYQGSLKSRYGKRWSKSLRGGTLSKYGPDGDIGG